MKENKKGRTWVCADIHGANRALVQCLERCNFDFQNDTLIQLGDIVDGWSESVEAVETLLTIPNLISIKGNHDVWADNFLHKGTKALVWLHNGGQGTYDEFITKRTIVDKQVKDFFKNQKDYYIDSENRLFIHAGWDTLYDFETGANLPLGEGAGEGAKTCHWDRSIIKNLAYLTKGGTLGEKDGIQYKALEEFKEIFIGHTVMQSYKPTKLLNLWALDTGAGWEGRLTIMDVDSKEYFQSDLVTDLYKGEKGRKG